MATQYHFMARTKKMADPYHVSDVLTSISQAFHDAEVSLDSVKVAKAETANIVAKFTLLKKENEELRKELFLAVNTLYEFKNKAEEEIHYAFDAISSIKKLFFDMSRDMSDVNVDIAKMSSKRARVDDDSDSDSDSDCNKN